MKTWKSILAILAFSVMLSSCHSTPSAQAMSDEILTHEDVFANRERKQRVMVETAKDFEFTVIFDREVYYVGDDINVRIVAKYIGDAEDYCVRRWTGYEAGEVLQADLYLNGERIFDCGGMSAPESWVDDWFEETHLSAGDCLENVGRFSTAVIADRFRNGDELVLRMRNTLGQMMEFPIGLCMDVPTDEVFLKYAEQEKISQALYRRLSVMEDGAKIGVYVSGANVDPQIQFAGISWQSEPFGNKHFGYHMLMTREQIIELLRYRENHSSADYRQLKYSYEYFFLGDWMLEHYPVEGVAT